MKHDWKKVKDEEAGVRWECQKCKFSFVFFRKAGPSMDGVTYRSGQAYYLDAKDGFDLNRVEEEAKFRIVECEIEQIRYVMIS